MELHGIMWTAFIHEPHIAYYAQVDILVKRLQSACILISWRI